MKTFSKIEAPHHSLILVLTIKALYIGREGKGGGMGFVCVRKGGFNVCSVHCFKTFKLYIKKGYIF